MSHLRNYRTRYINKERQGKPVDIPGDEVLKYIQDCFENCAKNLAVCSPAVSCSSSSTLQQDQDEFPFESEEKEQPEPEICLPNEFNAVSCVLSPNNKDKSPGENVSEDDEESNIGDFLEDDIDILALGSPALIQLDENFEEINAANVDPEGDCEFLIEDSIGMSSRSLVSASQKKQKQQRKDVISAPSGSKKEANKPSLRKIDSNASEKPVPPSLVNQTKMKSTNVAEATAGRLKNISLTSEMMSLIDDQPLLVLNTFQEERQKIHSKGMASKEISNKIPAGINNTEDHVALLEENDSASIQSQPVLGTEESSSNGKGTVKHKHSKTKTSIERQNEENQKNAPVIMDLENNKSFENIGSVLRPILSMEPSEQKSSNKNSQPAGLKSHNKKLLKKQKNPRTAQSEKQPQTQRSAIKEPVIRPTRRKKIVLASDESSETEHEDEHLNKGVKNSNSYKLNKPNHSREASQKRRQTSSNSEGSDCERVSYQEDAVCLTEERLYPSEKQANSTTDSIQNAATVDPEYDCEFLIEESFGMSFRSLISASQKKQQPQRKNVISAPSGSKKVNKPSVRKKDKKTSEKPVPQNLVNQTKIKSTDVAETTVGRLKNVSMTSEIMPLIEDQQLLVLNTSQEGRQNIHSKGVAAEEISSTIPAGINKTENHAALLEENDSASVQSQPVLRTEESSSNGKGAVKHKHSKTKTSVERQNEENQDNAPVIMDFENNQPFENIDTYSEHSDSLLRPILSVEPAEQKPSNKNSQSAGLKSNNKKLLKRQKPPRTAQSKKQPQTQRSAIKESVIRPTRRKKIVLVSDESSETEHEDEHHDKGVKNYSYELKKPNNSREASQKRRQASLISSEDSDCERVSYQEDSFCLTEERLYSEKQSNSTADSLQ
nr:PREDICTED: centromere protein C-like [Anolis carolinensis]|eukprot:XP_008111249.1 PREDICTED: centromere protein C-like [Anolis carolinensis]